MPRRSQKKRAQRRQRQLENDINTNGVEKVEKGGEFRVFDKRSNQYITGPVSLAKAKAVWRECPDCIYLSYKPH